MNWAGCSDIDGKCDCPIGFGGNDCGQVRCGSPPRGLDRPLRNGPTCNCDDGWGGINCNICQRDDVCDSMIPTKRNGTCYNSINPVRKNELLCDIKNKAIVKLLGDKKAQLSFGCDKDNRKCRFEFWAGEQESFFCKLNSCQFESETKVDKNVTTILCPHMHCSCFPNRLLCDPKGLDFTEWFNNVEEGPYGPGTFTCEEYFDSKRGLVRNCEFSEPNINIIIGQFFGDNTILLSCANGGECIHQSEVPGFQPPESKEFELWVIILFAVTFLLTFLGIFLGVLHLKRRSDSGYWTVNTNDEETAPLIDLLSSHTPCGITFRDLSYSIPCMKKIDDSHRISPADISNAEDSHNVQVMQQMVLEGIHGSVNPGEILAIMGGSGAGKTTCLDILARRNKIGITGGDVLVNDKFMSFAEYREITGYVDQEDTLMETLTVYETILHSALLRLPRNLPLSAKKAKVEECMTELGILGIANRRIGGAGKRGLSGGEKRRVSIACELVTSPNILFLDEPTSGTFIN